MSLPSKDSDVEVDRSPSGRLPIVGAFALTFRIFGRAPLTFAGLLLLQALATTIVTYIADCIVGSLAQGALVEPTNFLLQQLSTALGIGAAIIGTSELAEDRIFALGDALAESARHVIPMFLVCLAQTLVAGVGVLLLVIGGSFAVLLAGMNLSLDRPLRLAFVGLCLTVPGLVLTILLAVALPACMVERLGPIASFKRSVDLTRGNRWRVLAVFAIGIAVAPLLIGTILLAIWKPGLVTYAIAAAGVVGTIALVLAWMILPTALYLELCALELRRYPLSATSRAIGTAVPDAL